VRKSSKIVLGVAHWSNPSAKPEWWKAPWKPIEDATRQELLSMMNVMCCKGMGDSSGNPKLMDDPCSWAEVPDAWIRAQEIILQSRHILCIGAGTL
jgi:hypothetical protein